MVNLQVQCSANEHWAVTPCKKHLGVLLPAGLVPRAQLYLLGASPNPHLLQVISFVPFLSIRCCWEPACVQGSRNKGFLRNSGLRRERDDGSGASSLQISAASDANLQPGHGVPGRQKEWRCPQDGTSCAVSSAEPLLGSCILPQPIPIHGGLDFTAVLPVTEWGERCWLMAPLPAALCLRRGPAWITLAPARAVPAK